MIPRQSGHPLERGLAGRRLIAQRADNRGTLGRHRVYLEAPPADRLDTETSCFLDLVNGAWDEPPLLEAGLDQFALRKLKQQTSSNKPCAPARRLVEASRTDRRRMRITSIDVGMFDGTGRERKQCFQ